MTRKECAELIRLVKIAFPKYLDGFSENMKQGAVSHWMEFIGDMDIKLAYLAVKEYLHTADTLYQSDNVPLLIADKAHEIRRAISSEFPLTKFAFGPVNNYVYEERRKRNKLTWADAKPLPPAWEQHSPLGLQSTQTNHNPTTYTTVTCEVRKDD
jgi:hypothetical protein